MAQIKDYPQQTTLNNTDEFILQETSGGVNKKVLFSTIKDQIDTDTNTQRLVNYILNGDCKVAQETTSTAAAANGAYIIDNCRYNKVGTMVHTVSQEVDSDGNYSVKLDCTTADGSIAAGDNCTARFLVEGFDYAYLKGKTCTLSFDIKSDNKTGTFCTAFKNNGSDRSYIHEHEITTNDFETKTVEVALDQTGGTENYTNDVGLQILFTLAAGSTFQSTAGSWQSGNYFATSSQDNFCDNTSNNIEIKNVSLTIGSSANFDRDLVIKESFQETLAKCQRYWQSSYNYGVTPGTVTDVGRIDVKLPGATGALRGLWANFQTVMVDTPTVTWYSPNSGTADRVYNITDTADLTVSSEVYTSDKSTGFPNVSVSQTDGDSICGHYVADARF